MSQHLSILGRFLKTVYLRFIEDACSYRAAALTFTTLLSIVPLMTVSFAIFSAFPFFNTISQEIQNFIYANFIATSGEVVQQYLQLFVEQAKNLSAIGSAFLVITAILMMFTMEQAFNAIWHVKSRGISLSTFMLYWAVLTLTPIIIGLSLIISTYITKLPVIAYTTHILHVLNVLPFVLTLLFLTILYSIVPNCPVSLGHSFVGALIAAVLLTLAKVGFTYYVIHFPSYTLVYGALAAIPLFLIWLYISWIIILFGVIINHALATGYRFRSTKMMDGFTHIYHWLGHFWKALQEGKHLSLDDLLKLDDWNYEVDPILQLGLMQQHHLIQATSAGRYILSQDLSQLTLESLLNKLPWRLPTLTEIAVWNEPWEINLKNIIEKNSQKMAENLQISLMTLYGSSTKVIS